MDSSLLHTLMVWAGIGMVFFALTMLAITDVLRKDFGSKRIKALWAFIAIFPFIGCFIYLLIGFRMGKVVRDSGPADTA